MPTQQNKLDTLMALEGSSNNGMIPMKDGTPIANSGTTIGRGVDLGAQTESSLRDMGMTPSTIATLKPYLGLKGQAAKTYLDSNPLTLSEGDTSTLNTGAANSYWTGLENDYNARVGRPLSELDDNKQLSLLSSYYNLGSKGLFGTADDETDFTTQLENKDYTGAANNMHTWSSITSGDNASLIPRRQAEAQMFQGLIGPDGLAEERDSRIPEYRRQLAAGEAPEAPFMAADSGLLSQVGYVPQETNEATQGVPVVAAEAIPQVEAGFLKPIDDFISGLFGGDKSGNQGQTVAPFNPAFVDITAPQADTRSGTYPQAAPANVLRGSAGNPVLSGNGNPLTMPNQTAGNVAGGEGGAMGVNGSTPTGGKVMLDILNGLFGSNAVRTGAPAGAARTAVQAVPQVAEAIPAMLSQIGQEAIPRTSARPNQQQVAPIAVPQATQEVPQSGSFIDDLSAGAGAIANRLGEGYAGYEGLTIPQSIGRFVGNQGDELSGMGTVISDSTGQAVDAVTSAVSDTITGIGEGYDASAIPNPGASTAYGDGMVKYSAELENLAKADSGIDKVIKNAAKEDGDKIAADIGEENVVATQKAAESVVKAVEDGSSMEEAMKGAGGFLGDLFKDPAIQRALIYYTGSRLMGYSGSGSGMAAGQVLLQGWSNQDKRNAANATATQTSAAEKSASEALDMSKTVTMWNPAKKEVETGYMSKSGKFQSSQGGPVVNAKDYGLETYNKTQHKTFDEIDRSNIDVAQSSAKDVLSNISNNSEIYDPAMQQTAQALFADGSAIQETLGLVTRSARSAGVDTSTPQFQTAMSHSIRKYMMSSIRNPTDTFDGSTTAGMADAIQADWIKADLTSEGGVPKHVFGKGTWTADGVESMEEGYELPNKAVSRLMRQTKQVNNALIANAIESGYTREKALSTITKTRTLDKLGKIFTDNVMSSSTARRYWGDLAEKTNTNAFNAWLSTTGTDVEDKYLGRKNPKIAKMVGTLYKENDFK
jgi:GH24 family phage-related lysozyme (muramidase)